MTADDHEPRVVPGLPERPKRVLRAEHLRDGHLRGLTRQGSSATCGARRASSRWSAPWWLSGRSPPNADEKARTTRTPTPAKAACPNANRQWKRTGASRRAPPDLPVCTRAVGPRSPHSATAALGAATPNPTRTGRDGAALSAPDDHQPLLPAGRHEHVRSDSRARRRVHANPVPAGRQARRLGPAPAARRNRWAINDPTRQLASMFHDGPDSA